MAKSSRASTTKANNQRLKAKVFGPVEAARQERLSAKLLEIASQPKPVPEREMEDAEGKGDTEQKEATGGDKGDDSKDYCTHRRGIHPLAPSLRDMFSRGDELTTARK